MREEVDVPEPRVEQSSWRETAPNRAPAKTSREQDMERLLAIAVESVDLLRDSLNVVLDTLGVEHGEQDQMVAEFLAECREVLFGRAETKTN